MKKLIIAIIVLLACTSCGVGTYSVSSGKADEAALSFAARHNDPIVVMVDQTRYEVNAVKTKEWKADMKIKKTAKNTLYTAPGQHQVRVLANDGNEIFNKTLILSTGEHRIENLHR